MALLHFDYLNRAVHIDSRGGSALRSGPRGQH